MTQRVFQDPEHVANFLEVSGYLVEQDDGERARKGKRREGAAKTKVASFPTFASIWPKSTILDKLSVPNHKE